MAIGFNTGSSYGSRQVQPDKGLSESNQPRVLRAQFGDGYQQRIIDGINNNPRKFEITVANQEKAVIDDIDSYLTSLNGVTAFNFTIPDTNAGGGEETIKVVCGAWSKNFAFDNFYNLTASLEEVFE